MCLTFPTAPQHLHGTVWGHHQYTNGTQLLFVDGWMFCTGHCRHGWMANIELTEVESIKARDSTSELWGCGIGNPVPSA